MYTVICIDDNPWILDDIRRTFDFAANGFEVAGEFTCAEDALPAILSLRPDLIISDIRMGQMSGLDLAGICREQGLDSIIVLLSGYERFDYAQAALRYQVFDYLLKPIDDHRVKELMERIRHTLHRKTAAAAPDTTDPFRKITDYIEAHYSQSISLNDVADHVHMNRTYVSELFTRRAGMSFPQYKAQVRIRHACDMIERGKTSMTDIAFAVGFESLSRFSRVFSQIKGVSPQQYRQQLRQEPTRGTDPEDHN